MPFTDFRDARRSKAVAVLLLGGALAEMKLGSVMQGSLVVSNHSFVNSRTRNEFDWSAKFSFPRESQGFSGYIFRGGQARSKHSASEQQQQNKQTSKNKKNNPPPPKKKQTKKAPLFAQ